MSFVCSVGDSVKIQKTAQANLQVGKGGMPPLKRSVLSGIRSTALVMSPPINVALKLFQLRTLRLSGGMPPFPTCKLAELESKFGWKRFRENKDKWVRS